MSPLREQRNRASFFDQIDNLLHKNCFARPEDIVSGLLEIGQDYSSVECEKFLLSTPKFEEYREIASAHYRQFIIESEDKEVSRILSAPSSGDMRSDSISRFGQDTYNRVADLFDVLRFSGRKIFALVGCGAWPATALHVHSKTNIEKIFCIDNRSSAIESLHRVKSSCELERIYPVFCEGDQFDFSEVDIAYIANLVEPKREVLRHISSKLPLNSEIVVREPYSIGHLFTSCATQVPNSTLVVNAVGRREPAFFSYNVFLKKLA